MLMEYLTSCVSEIECKIGFMNLVENLNLENDRRSLFGRSFFPG